MTSSRVSIGRVKRDISALVNRVAYGGERILLTSRGKPKAALVSLEDYEKLTRLSLATKLSRWESWLAESDSLKAEILARRGEEPLDVETLWQAAQADLEVRDDQILAG
jgi:prevent-host-death family protein